MREEIYLWMQNVAVFYIVLTSFLHLVPDPAYERYVRFFMGILLIVIMSTPILALLGKSRDFMTVFQEHYLENNLKKEQRELESFREEFLEQETQRTLQDLMEEQAEAEEGSEQNGDESRSLDTAAEQNGETAVADSDSSGSASDGDRHAGIR